MSQSIPCPLCHHDTYTILYEDLPDYMTNVAGRFRLVVCRSCQLIYQNPQLTANELEAHYPNDYTPYFQGTKETLSPFCWWLLNYGMRKRVRPLLRHQAVGRLLDVGCATGHFLYYMKEQTGWQVQGVEPNAEAAQFAREHFQLDVQVGTLVEAHFPDHSFDAVTMWDVLEHLTDPTPVLLEIKRILKPGGQLLVRVPIAPCLDARLFGRFWIGLDPPRHTLVFSQQTLSSLLQQASFTITSIEQPSGSFFPFMLSLQFALFSHFGRNWITEGCMKVLRSLPVRLCTAPYFFVVDRLGLGPQTTILARVNNNTI